MSQNHPNIALHGWINLYKPKGISSAKVLNTLKRLLPRKHKVGHAGTLDPLAEGVLPVAIGEATKTIPYVQADDKEYIFQITWGESRTTGDAEGEISASSPNRPTLEHIENILPQFRGSITQIPPAYSALKIDGKRAYELARLGEKVILPSRTVHIYYFEIIENIPSKTTTFKVGCSKGTYVRSLAMDLARELNTEGYVSSLIRSRVGHFLQKDALDTEKLVALQGEDLLCRSLLSIVDVLDDILAIDVDSHDEQHLRQGRVIQAKAPERLNSGTALCIRAAGKQPVAIVKISEKGLEPIRVFNIDT